MKHLISISFLLLASLQADVGYIGLNAFAATNSKFPCRKYVRQVSKSPRPIMAILWGTFSDSQDPTWCVKLFTDRNRNRRHAVEIHISCEVCRRNRKMFEGELLPRLSVAAYNKALISNDSRAYKAIERRVSDISQSIDAFKNEKTRIFISTGLEDNFSKKSFESLQSFLQTKIPYRLVRASYKENSILPDTFAVELHGLRLPCHKVRTFASNDGDSITIFEAATLRKNYSQCHTKLLWDADLQGVGAVYVKPRDRDFKFSPELILKWKDFLQGKHYA